MMKKRSLPLLIFFIFLGHLNAAASFKTYSYDRLKMTDARLAPLKYKREKPPTMIVFHTSGKNLMSTHLASAAKRGKMLHYSVSKKGNIYAAGEPGFEENIYFKAAYKTDPYAIHILLQGHVRSIHRYRAQVSAAAKLVNYLAKQYSITESNYDIASRNGVFTHTQAMKKFGSFTNMVPGCGGETALKTILAYSGGKYYSELQWKNRDEESWVHRKETKKTIKNRGELNRGRYITPLPKADLKTVVQDKKGNLYQKYRLKYNYWGDLEKEGRCVVLHFTATKTLKVTMNVLENRHLAATFGVDTRGRVYQWLDSVNHRAAAASGSNENCMQVEIVGMGENALLRNKAQMRGVIKLLKELNQKYNIPLNNYDIESFKGVFSHEQTKKKWGRSGYLWGTRFDPGERYMKAVIEGAGGKYYPEKKWKDRNKEGEWVFILDSFQP